MARSRNKDPQALRQSLLDFATHLIVTQGLHGLTMDKVVKGTGISKGVFNTTSLLARHW
ncbi:TetR family transcriptional regulator [Mangrovibacter sp. SLW1]